MENYKIYPICTGVFQHAEKSNFAYQKDAGVKLKSPILCYLVQGNGHNILVDSGGSDEKWAAKYHHPVKQTEDMKPVNALKKFGLEPEDIDIIINTHLHWDHSFNNHLFPNAKIYAQKKEIEFAMDPIPTHYTYYESWQIGMKPQWTQCLERFIVVDGDYHLMDGIDLIFAPGHTPGFQVVSVNTTDGPFLIASDSTGIIEAWEDNQTCGLPTPSGIHVNLIDYYNTIRKLYPKYDQYHILPGHDAKALEHDCYPYK